MYRLKMVFVLATAPVVIVLFALFAALCGVFLGMREGLFTGFHYLRRFILLNRF